MNETSAGFLEGTSGPYRDLVDYILGITHEIWESRQVERIHAYYSRDCEIYTLGGIIRGADTVVRNTWETLAAFPDRLLLGDAVIWSREGAGTFYSSHRISSPMTNRGASAFGPATGRAVRVATIAECVVEQGVITREWLVRDNHGLAQQLGFNTLAIAREQARRPQQPEHAQWLAAERERVRSGAAHAREPGDRRAPVQISVDASSPAATPRIVEFAREVLRELWVEGDDAALERLYAPYAVLYDSVPIASGRKGVAEHYRGLRAALGDVALSIDHVCARSVDEGAALIAVRWMLDARHIGTLWGLDATGRAVSILGVTHWHVVAGRIAAEWTIYDRIAALAQLCRSADA